MKVNGYIAELRLNGTVKAIYVRMGGFENLERYHNTQVAVDKLMEYDEFNNIGNADFIPDNEDIYDENKTCYSDKDKLRQPLIFNFKEDFEDFIEKDVLSSRAYLWDRRCWQKLK